MTLHKAETGGATGGAYSTAVKSVSGIIISMIVSSRSPAFAAESEHLLINSRSLHTRTVLRQKAAGAPRAEQQGMNSSTLQGSRSSPWLRRGSARRRGRRGSRATCGVYVLTGEQRGSFTDRGEGGSSQQRDRQGILMYMYVPEGRPALGVEEDLHVEIALQTDLQNPGRRG